MNQREVVRGKGQQELLEGNRKQKVVVRGSRSQQKFVEGNIRQMAGERISCLSAYLTPLNPLSVRPYIRSSVRPAGRQSHFWARRALVLRRCQKEAPRRGAGLSSLLIISLTLVTLTKLAKDYQCQGGSFLLVQPNLWQVLRACWWRFPLPNVNLDSDVAYSRFLLAQFSHIFKISHHFWFLSCAPWNTNQFDKFRGPHSWPVCDILPRLSPNLATVCRTSLL